MSLLKRAAGFKVFLDVLLVIVAFFFIVAPQVRGECSMTNPDCGYGKYCGIDNRCHVFERQEVVEHRTLSEKSQVIFIPLLISLLIIGGAAWYRFHDDEE